MKIKYTGNLIELLEKTNVEVQHINEEPIDVGFEVIYWKDLVEKAERMSLTLDVLVEKVSPENMEAISRLMGKFVSGIRDRLLTVLPLVKKEEDWRQMEKDILSLEEILSIEAIAKYL